MDDTGKTTAKVSDRDDERNLKKDFVISEVDRGNRFMLIRKMMAGLLESLIDHWDGLTNKKINDT